MFTVAIQVQVLKTSIQNMHSGIELAHYIVRWRDGVAALTATSGVFLFSL